jgi:phosphocarrier protein HPr
MMKQKKIKISSIAEAKELVKLACECDFDINVFYNRVIIDAKSILGVLSLDLTKVLTVEYNGEDKNFEEFLADNETTGIHAVA